MKKLLFILVVSAVGSAFGQTRVANIFSQKVLDTMPSFRQAQVFLEQEQRSGARELATLEAEINELYRVYQEGALTNPKVVLDHQQKVIMQKEQEYQQKQTNIQRNIQDLASQLNDPILKKLQSAVEQVCKAEKYDYAVDHSALMYFNKMYDITDKVIAIAVKMDKDEGIEYPIVNNTTPTAPGMPGDGGQ